MITGMPLSGGNELTGLSLRHLFYVILIRTGNFLRKAMLLLRRKGAVRFAAWTDMHLKIVFMHARGIGRGFMRKELSHGLFQKFIRSTARHEGALQEIHQM